MPEAARAAAVAHCEKPRWAGGLDMSAPPHVETIEAQSGGLGVSIEQACDMLGGLSRWTILRLIDGGGITARKVGRRTIIDRASVQRYWSSTPRRHRRCARGTGRRRIVR
jgi:excisionase family DNA binding protein